MPESDTDYTGCECGHYRGTHERIGGPEKRTYGGCVFAGGCECSAFVARVRRSGSKPCTETKYAEPEGVPDFGRAVFTCDLEDGHAGPHQGRNAAGSYCSWVVLQAQALPPATVQLPVLKRALNELAEASHRIEALETERDTLQADLEKVSKQCDVYLQRIMDLERSDV